MGKRQKSYVLLVICILMQVASAFPHHHHGRFFCMHSDLTYCASLDECCGNTCPEKNGEAHTCGTDCITHFQCASPDSHNFTFTSGDTFCTILYFCFCEFSLLSPDLLSKGRELPLYCEALYSTETVRPVGLRAPPFSI